MSEQRPTSAPDPTGHYGPGYADPTGPLVQKEDTELATGMKPAVEPSAEPSGGPLLDPSEIGSDVPDEAVEPRSERPDFTSEDVGVRPPDEAPKEDAPASENAALIFERS